MSYDDSAFWVMAALSVIAIIVLFLSSKVRAIVGASFRAPLSTSHIVPTPAGWGSTELADGHRMSNEDEEEFPQSAVDLMEALRQSVLRARVRREEGIPRQRTRDEAAEQQIVIPQQSFTSADFESVRHQLDEMERRIHQGGHRAFSGDRGLGDDEE